MLRSKSQIDSTIEVVTPENIAFEYRVAGPFRRLPAFLLDLLIRTVAFWAVVAVLSIFLSFVLGPIVGAIILVSWFVVEWFYGGLFETFMNGQTPGKRLTGLRVLTTDGQPINGLQAVMRNVLRFADMMPLVSLQILNPFFESTGGQSVPPAYIIPTCGVALLAMAMSGRYQRLGDLVCGTIVVIEERHWLLGLARLEDPRAAQLAAYLPADFVVNRSLAKTLASYVERRRFFSVPRRREVARHLGQPLLEQFGLPSDTSHDLLLCALYYRAFIADRGDESQNDRSDDSPFALGASQYLASSGMNQAQAAMGQQAKTNSMVNPYLVKNGQQGTPNNPPHSGAPPQ